MRLFLLNNGHGIAATQPEKYDFVIKIASGKIRYEEILMWLEKYSVKI
jgi:death on curing protein